MDSSSDRDNRSDEMDPDPSYILATMKAASLAVQNVPQKLPTFPPSTIEKPTIVAPHPSTELSRRRRAYSDPSGYDGRAKKLKLLHPEPFYVVQPVIPRLPYGEPPMFDYSRFDHYDKAQKKFKEMANGNQGELTWKRNYLDTLTEFSLLDMHLDWAKLAREEVVNLGGLKEERRFLKGLKRALREKREAVIGEMIENNKAFGKGDAEMDEVDDFLETLMDEENES